MLSTGRAPDPTNKTVAELRDAERRLIPLDVNLQASEEYSLSQPIEVTVSLTNLFDAPILLNRRMLVNHPLMPGEVYFRIEGPDGKFLKIQHLATPFPVRDDDFVVLARGHSVQRSINLADLYPLKKKGLYNIRVYYHNEVDKPLGAQRAWHGAIVSTPIQIKVN
jgi:hypothetical protein